MSSHNESRLRSESGQVVIRPREVIQFLPPQYQWEFTRRHPYYLLFWQAARRHRRDPSSDEVQSLMDAAAAALLTAINVSDAPCSPSTSFEELDSASPLPQTWRSGAFSQMSFRGLTGCFLFLPTEIRRAAGQLILDSLDVDFNDPVARNTFIERLPRLPAEFDAFPVAPLVSLNLQAPQRAILEAVEEYVRSEKQRLGIPERRRREGSLPDFLTVWDRREGWTGAGYDGNRDLTLRDIAQASHESIETIRNRYNSAFSLIVGHDYSPELWDQLFGRLKLAGLFGAVTPSWQALRRPTRSRRVRPVPESRLLRNEASRTAAIYAQADALVSDGVDFGDLLHDIRSLISAGATNEEIISAVELRSDVASEIVDAIRGRALDNL